MKLWQFVTDALLKRIQALERKVKTMPTQADLDAITAEVAQSKADFDDLVTRVDARVADLQAQIDALKAGNPSLDLSGLQSIVDATKADIDATQVP